MGILANMWRFSACFLFILHFTHGVKSSSCPHGYKLLNELCYGLVETPANWKDAQTACRNVDGQLAEPRTAVIDFFLTGMAVINNTAVIWVGGEDLTVEGEFRWASDGDKIGNYTRWTRGQPDYEDNQDCVTIVADPDSAFRPGWHDD